MFRFVLVLILSGMVHFAAEAKEERMVPTMPKADTTPLQLKAAKQSGWKCQKKKTDALSGNPKTVAGTKPVWVKDVKDDTDAAESRLEGGKSAVFCTLMQYDKTKHKFANAELGEASDD